MATEDNILKELNKRGYNVYAFDFVIGTGSFRNIGEMIKGGLAITQTEYFERQMQGTTTEGVQPFGCGREDVRYFIIPACDTPNDSDEVIRATALESSLGRRMIGPLNLSIIENALDISRLPNLRK